MYMYCDISVAIKFAFGSSVNEFLFLICVHIGVWARGGKGAAAPPKLGQLRFLGQQEKFGQSQF